MHQVSQEIYQNCCDHPVKAKTKFHVLFNVSYDSAFLGSVFIVKGGKMKTFRGMYSLFRKVSLRSLIPEQG